jgi:60 kDa SS-A/Ro ribonucleoprotein
MPSEGGIISNAQSIPVNGGGTNITLPFQYLIQKNIFVDRIVVLSDNELNRKYSFTCQHYVEQYKKINPNVWVHGIDLQGYGTQQFMGKNVNLISGWSEKVFDFINTAEFGLGTMLNKIEGYYF